MSHEQDAPSEVADGEWESAVQRISEKLRAGSAGPGQSQLAEELVRLEQRALEAEETLARERHAYTGRVREMEEKLRKLEPWLRKLKTQFQSVTEERDRLNDRLARLEENTQIGQEADRDASDRAIRAAIAERDAARRELEEFRSSNESQIGDVQGVWEQRLREATEQRDALQRDVEEARARLRDAQRAADDVALLQKHVQELEVTLAAERSAGREAVRRAKLAGEAVEDERRRAEDAAEAARARSDELAQLEEALQRARDEANAAKRATDEARAQSEDARRRLGQAEAAAESLRGEIDEQRSVAESRATEAGSAREELERLQRTIEKLRGETAEAKQAAAKLAEETEFARRTHESLRAELDESRAALELATAESARHARDVADRVTRTQELEGIVDQVRKEAAEAAEQAAARHAAIEQKRVEDRAAHRAAEERLRDMDVDLSDVRRRAETAEADLAEIRTTLASQEAENAGLVRALADERAASANRLATLEETHASQFEAARAVADAEALRLRRELEDVRTQLSDSETMAERAAARHTEESVMLRTGISSLVSDAVRRLTAGAAKLVGDAEDLDLPELPVAAPVADDEQEPIADFDDSEAGGEWEQLLTNLEALRSEVEDFRPEALLPDMELHSFDALAGADAVQGGHPGEERTASIQEQTDDLVGVGLLGTQTLEIDPTRATRGHATGTEELSDTSVSIPPDVEIPDRYEASHAMPGDVHGDDTIDATAPESALSGRRKNRRRNRRGTR